MPLALLLVVVAPEPTRPAGALSPFQQALDRLGIPLELPLGKTILVKIPAFELIALVDGAPELRSRVIVGTPWHRTPILVSWTNAVRFRPTWHPTPGMVVVAGE